MTIYELICIVAVGFILGGTFAKITTFRRYRRHSSALIEWLNEQHPEGTYPTPTPALSPPMQSLADHLRAWVQRSQEAFSGQSEFAEHAAHELQTPLSVIKAQAELLLQAPSLRKEDLQALGLILQHTQRLAKVNQALILLSRIGEGKFSGSSNIRIADTLDQILDRFSDLIAARALQVSWKLQEAVVVQLHPDLADILFTNLIHNAIRHNTNGGWIHLTLTDSTLTIRNSGVPLHRPAEDMFSRFVRQSDTEDGLGLGLSIVRRIAQVSGLSLQYTAKGNQHAVRIRFP